MPEIETGQINLTYPITFDPATFQQYNLPAYFGGFQVNTIMMTLSLNIFNLFQVSEIGTVEKIEAISLTYFLDQSEEWQVSLKYKYTNRRIQI